MGSHTDPRYTQDKNALFERILARYDATYFDPSAITPRARSRVWLWLADDAFKRGAPAGMQASLQRSWKEWQSPSNPALWRLLIGRRGWLAWLTAGAQARSKWVWLKRRLG